MDKREDAHLVDERLLLHVDGELSGREEDAVREHLDACWSCRARLDELQATINTVARFRNEVLLPAVPEPPQPWPGLRPRLEALGSELHERSVAQRLGDVFRRRSANSVERPDSTVRIYRRVGAIAAMVGVAVWLGTDSASAAAARRALVRFAEYVTAPVRKPAVPAAPGPIVASRPSRTEPRVVPMPKPVAPLNAPAKSAPRRLTFRELIELDLDVVSRLDQVGAFLGEQLTVERDAQRGELRVRAVVDSAARKRELVESLGSLVTHRAVVIDVSTVTEAVAKQTRLPTGQVTVRSVEIDTKPTPVHEELRRYVVEKLRRETGGGDDEALIRREIQAFTVNVLNRSLQARLHARALTQTVDRYSPEERQNLSRDARRSWHRIIRQHAASFQRETAALRSALQPLFFASGGPDDVETDSAITTDADLSRIATRLFELGSSHDATIARAFSHSTEEPKPQPPVWESFQRSLAAAERLAARLANGGTPE